MKNLFKTLMFAGASTLLLATQSYIAPEESKSASFNTAFELKLDEKVFLPKSKKELSVSLVTISDNRCPENVQCITAGKAIAEIKLTNKQGSEAITKLVLEQSATASDAIAVTLDGKNYTVVLSEVNKLYANKVKVVISKSTI